MSDCSLKEIDFFNAPLGSLASFPPAPVDFLTFEQRGTITDDLSRSARVAFNPVDLIFHLLCEALTLARAFPLLVKVTHQLGWRYPKLGHIYRATFSIDRKDGIIDNVWFQEAENKILCWDGTSHSPII
jgi:hypothetical protein